MNLCKKSKLWQKLLRVLSLHLVIACGVKGHGLVTSSTYNGVWYGTVCMDPPTVKPTCGWMILLASSPSLTSVVIFSQATVEMRNNGQEFYMTNVSYSGASPTTTAQYCLNAEITGSFGSTPPSYVALSWYCICSTSTTTTAISATTSSVTAISSNACTTPPNTTMTTTPAASITTASAVSVERPKGNGFFTKRAGYCYISSLELSDLTNKMLCFHACLLDSVCKGVNVEAGSYTDRCLLVNTNVLDFTQLVSSDICNFWKKE